MFRNFIIFAVKKFWKSCQTEKTYSVQLGAQISRNYDSGMADFVTEMESSIKKLVSYVNAPDPSTDFMPEME